MKTKKQKNKKTKFVVFIFSLFFCFYFFINFVLAADPPNTHYIREGANGNNSGSDWANALPALPNNLQRNHIYYVADGNYPYYIFDDALSGTQWIIIKKATISDHGTDTGWNNIYGDERAIFNRWRISTSYIELDGGLTFGYGFEVNSSDPTFLNSVVRVNGNFSNIKIKSLSVDSENAPDSQSSIQVDCPSACSDLLFSNIEAKKSGNDCFMLSNVYNSIFEYLHIHSRIDTAFDGRGFEMRGGNDNVHIRYSRFNWDGSMIFWRDSNISDIYHIYGNVFYNQPENGIAFISQAGDPSVGPVYIYNNTFYNIKSVASLLLRTTGQFKNNLIYNVADASIYGSVEHDYNASDINLGEASSQLILSDPFIDAVNANFRLNAETDHGYPFIGITYRVDSYGNIRGQDGNWDRGAFEYDTGSIGDIQAPVIFNGLPGGVLPAGTKNTVLSVSTDEPTICKYSELPNIAYPSIINTFPTIGSTIHSEAITGLLGGISYNYYVRCQDASYNVNSSDYIISFSVEDSLPVGSFDILDQDHVSGWAYDEDKGEDHILVHIYVDGVMHASEQASLERLDLVPVVGSANHGFNYTFAPPLVPGTHTVNIYAINVPTGTNPELSGSPKTILIDVSPPVLFNGSPSGVLPAGTTQAIMSLDSSDESNPVVCKYSTVAGESYYDMTNTFTVTGGDSHSTTINGLVNNSAYTYYVRCEDSAGNANMADYQISFSVDSFVCSDFLDNDGDTLIDFPADPGCTSATDNDELGNTVCDDGVDNDSDGLIDFPHDPGCADSLDDDEFNDITAPVISNIIISNLTPNSVTISWITDEPTDTQIEYGLAPGIYTQTTNLIDTAPMTVSHTQTINGLLADTTYHFRVRSSDDWANVSFSSNHIFITPKNPDITPPTKPAGLNAVVVEDAGEEKVLLGWDPSTDPVIPSERNSGVSQYSIIRNSTIIGGTFHPSVSFLDGNNIQVPSVYVYEIIAIDNAGIQSDKSDPLTVIVNDILRPTAPQNLTADVIENLNIQLNWTPSTDNVGVINYKIYRNDVPPRIIGNVTDFFDGILLPETTYTYQVSALDNEGNESNKSQSVSATTGEIVFIIEVDVIAPGISDGIVKSSPSAISCGMGEADCLKAFSENSTVVLRVEPDYYTSYFTGWGEACGSGREQTCQLENINQNLVVKANFDLDTEPPTVPINLRVTPIINRQMQITINTPSTDNSWKVKGYEVFRDGNSVGETEQGITSFRDIGGLEPGNSYTYTVTAKDYSGNVSAASAPVSAVALGSGSIENPTEILDIAGAKKEGEDSWYNLKNKIIEKYELGIGLAGILAVFMLLVGSFHLLVSGGNAGNVTKGKAYIGGALFGLILALSSYFILETVNPNITNLVTYKNIDVIPNLNSECDWYKTDCENLKMQDADLTKCGLKAAGIPPSPEDNCCCAEKAEENISGCCYQKHKTRGDSACENMVSKYLCDNTLLLPGNVSDIGIFVFRDFIKNKSCSDLSFCLQFGDECQGLADGLDCEFKCNKDGKDCTKGFCYNKECGCKGEGEKNCNILGDPHSFCCGGLSCEKTWWGLGDMECKKK